MSRRTFWIVMPISALLLLGLAAYAGISYFIYDQLSSVRHGGGDDAANTPAQFVNADQPVDLTPYQMPEYEAITITSRTDALDLAAWYIPGDPGAPAVIVVHGLGSCKCSSGILLVAGMLHRAGFNVAALDLRDMGMSEIEDGRHAAGTNEYLDVLGVFDWLVQEKGFAPQKIGLFGGSLGAATVLNAFAAEPQVAAVFADSPFANMDITLREELERNNYPAWLASTGLLMARIVSGDDLMSRTPVDAMVNHLGRPIFLTHGEADTRLYVHHTQDLLALAQANGANVQAWFVPGSEHVDAMWDHTAEYEQKLVDFFTTALGK